MFWLDRHRLLRDQLSAYIDGALDTVAVRRLEAHLGECEGCRAELEQLRSTVDALRELPEVEVPRSFALRPEQAAVRRPAVPVAPLAFGARMAAAGVAVALAVVLVVDFGDLGGDGGAPGVAPTGMIAEYDAKERGLEAESDAAAAGEEPKAEGGAPSEPYGTPTPSPVPSQGPVATVVVPDGAEGAPISGSLTPEPEAEIQEAVPTSGGGGGIDALTAAEIGLASALGILIIGSLALALAGRKR